MHSTPRNRLPKVIQLIQHDTRAVADDLRNDRTVNGSKNDWLSTTTMVKTLVLCSSASVWVLLWMASTSVHHTVHVTNKNFLFYVPHITNTAPWSFRRKCAHIHSWHVCTEVGAHRRCAICTWDPKIVLTPLPPPRFNIHANLWNPL